MCHLHNILRLLGMEIPKRQGFGIAYFVYHQNATKLLEFYERTFTSASTFRTQSSSLQIALIISDPSVIPTLGKHPFNFIITIPEIIVFPTANRGEGISYRGQVINYLISFRLHNVSMSQCRLLHFLSG